MSFVTGATGKGQSLAVLAQVEAEGELLDEWRVGFWEDGDWRSELELDFKPVAISPFGERPDAWAVLGFEGEVLWIEDATTQQTIREDRVAASSQAAFTTIRSYGAGIAAAQMGRQVHWSDGTCWRPLGSGMTIEQSGEIVGFEALAAFEGELYASGWKGEIWYLESGLWRRVDTPTSMILTGAAAHVDEMIICGRLATILRGRRDQWVVVDHQQTDEDFWSVAVFQGRTYLSSMLAIYELVDERLVPVDDGSTTGTYYHLAANDQIMASIGAETVLVKIGRAHV